MPETIKKGIIKKKTDANNTVILYPKTTIDQVEDLEDVLDNKVDKYHVIEKVNSLADVPNEELGLFRYTEEADFGEQSSHIIEVIKKDYDATEVLFEKITQTNNTSLTTTTFFDQFANTLPGWLALSSASIIYALYYAPKEGGDIQDPVSGIRFGAGSSAGSLTFTLSADCELTFYKYFSYNGSTGAIVSYDAAAKVIVDGVDHTFVDDTTPVVISLAAGTHTISSYYYQDPETGTKTTGRIILTSLEFEGDPYTAYEQKELARVEDVEEVDDDLQQYKTTSHNRFVTDEQNIETNRQDIVDINGRIGDIQVFQCPYANLPEPSAEYKNKLYRDKYAKAIYQCIKLGEGISKDWNFANVSGTSEITATNVSSFYGNVGDDFHTYFDVDYEDSATNKFYRNNGSLKLGSSSAVGALSLSIIDTVVGETPLTSLKVGIKAYNNNGSTCQITIKSKDPDVSNTYFNSNKDTETLIDLSDVVSELHGINYIRIESLAQHNTAAEDQEPVYVNNDKRLIITRIVADFGEDTSYEWVPAGVPEIAFTDTLKIKNLPIGGSYLYRPDEGSGCLVRKYYDGGNNYTELYFQRPDGYNYYEGNNIENTTVQNAYDNSSWNNYITGGIKSLNTNNAGTQTPTSESITGSGTIQLHKVSKTGSYNDLLNKPTIPTVNDATLTITQNSTSIGTFTANASSNVTIDVVTPQVKRYI